MWLLAESSGATTLQQLDLTKDDILRVVPEASGADAVAQSPSGVVGVAVARGGAGSLELRNASGQLEATVPVGDPARDVVAGAGGTTFYVLNGDRSSMSVTLIDEQTRRALDTVPVPLDTLAVAVDPSETDLFALERDGNLAEITVNSGAVIKVFNPGISRPLQVCISPDGGELYVLRHAGDVETDVDVVAVGLHRVTRTVTAPDGAVDLAISLDGTTLYGIVGATGYGSVQLFPSG
jgi:DNA-binding beta-propeller fold protein YncE